MICITHFSSDIEKILLDFSFIKTQILLSFFSSPIGKEFCDCSQVEKLRKKNKNFQTTFSHFDTRNVNKSVTHITLVGIYMFQINNINTKTRCELCSKLTKTPGRRY